MARRTHHEPRQLEEESARLLRLLCGVHVLDHVPQEVQPAGVVGRKEPPTHTAAAGAFRAGLVRGGRARSGRGGGGVFTVRRAAHQWRVQCFTLGGILNASPARSRSAACSPLNSAVSSPGSASLAAACCCSWRHSSPVHTSLESRPLASRTPADARASAPLSFQSVARRSGRSGSPARTNSRPRRRKRSAASALSAAMACRTARRPRCAGGRFASSGAAERVDERAERLGGAQGSVSIWMAIERHVPAMNGPMAVGERSGAAESAALSADPAALRRGERWHSGGDRHQAPAARKRHLVISRAQLHDLSANRART